MRTSYSDQSVRLWICRTLLISYSLTGLILLKLQPKKKRMCSDCISKVKVTTGLCLKFSSKQYNLSLWPNLTEPSFTDYKVYSDPELSFYDKKIWLLCKIFVSTIYSFFLIQSSLHSRKECLLVKVCSDLETIFKSKKWRSFSKCL